MPEVRHYDPEYCVWLEAEVKRNRDAFIPSLMPGGHNPYALYLLYKDVKRGRRASEATTTEK